MLKKDTGINIGDVVSQVVWLSNQHSGDCVSISVLTKALCDRFNSTVNDVKFAVCLAEKAGTIRCSKDKIYAIYGPAHISFHYKDK